MFKNYSREQFLRIISALFMIGTLFGVNTMEYGLSEEGVADAMVTIIAVISLIVDGVGFLIRATKGDVTLGGFRK